MKSKTESTPKLFGKPGRKTGECWDWYGVRIEFLGGIFFGEVQLHMGKWFDVPSAARIETVIGRIEREIEKMRKHAEKLGT